MEGVQRYTRDEHRRIRNIYPVGEGELSALNHAVARYVSPGVAPLDLSRPTLRTHHIECVLILDGEETRITYGKL